LPEDWRTNDRNVDRQDRNPERQLVLSGEVLADTGSIWNLAQAKPKAAILSGASSSERLQIKPCRVPPLRPCGAWISPKASV
jgi:hypothetical protein